MFKLIKLLFISLLLFSCSEAKTKKEITGKSTTTLFGDTEKATFAGGCFWCIEAPFEGLEGIISVRSGYAGGKEKNPTYSDVSSGKTGHREAVQIVYDPAIISFEEVLDIFWKQFDPTDDGGSFFDRGQQYSSAVFYHSSQQKSAAEASKKRLNKSGKFQAPVITPIIRFTNFYPAEDYHQDYYKKQAKEYKAYRLGSGRDQFIAEHWGTPNQSQYPAPSRSELKNMLTDLQYRVTMEEATERAFDNPYDSNKTSGIYVCIVSGAPLFSSSDKFDSKTGWPSFTKPIDARFLTKKIDKAYGMTRVEVRSRFGNSHSGHVFNDGPPPTNLRYCMNSASFRFIPKEKMKESGYENYLWLVD